MWQSSDALSHPKISLSNILLSFYLSSATGVETSHGHFSPTSIFNNKTSSTRRVGFPFFRVRVMLMRRNSCKALPTSPVHWQWQWQTCLLQEVQEVQFLNASLHWLLRMRVSCWNKNNTEERISKKKSFTNCHHVNKVNKMLYHNHMYNVVNYLLMFL